MTIYLLYFVFPIFFYLLSNSIKISSILQPLWFSYLILLTIFVGFRYNVGGDWIIYDEYFNLINSTNDIFKTEIGSILSVNTEFGYDFIILLFKTFGLDIVHLNLFLSIIFFLSLTLFFNILDNKYLAIIISFPFAILLLGMGFQRQAISFSFLLFAVYYLSKDKKNIFYLFLILGIFFHKSLIIFIFYYFFEKLKNISSLFSKNSIIILSILIIFLFIFRQNFLSLIDIYLLDQSKEFEPSKGAYYRIFPSFISAIIYLYFYKNLNYSNDIKSFFLYLTFISIFTSIIMIILPTFADRLNLYLLPLQIFVFTNIITISGLKKYSIIIELAIISFYFLFLLVWLTFATHRQFWIPYNNYLFQ